MNKILRLGAYAFGFALLSGCAGTLMDDGAAWTVPADEPCDGDFAGAGAGSGTGCGQGSGAETQGQAAFAADQAGASAGAGGPVNYADVAAEHKAYGERSPRDQRVTQAGAGNNISATLPPEVEDEVLDYEDDVKARDDAEAEKDAAAADSAEDPSGDWLAEEGRSLKDILTEWSDKAGWRLVWKTNRNYTLTAGAMFRGRFADVSSALVRAFGRAKPAPVGTFYKGNRVLVIETLEDENAY